MLERSNISPFIGTWKEYQWKDTVQHEHFFLLMVEHHSFGVALTTPSKRKYWPAVSFALKIFSLPRKIVSLDTKSPTLPFPHVSWKKARYKDLPLLRIYLLFQTSWFIISSLEHASFPVRVDLASKRLCKTTA